MTTGVGSTEQAKAAEWSRSKKDAKAEHEQAFDAALAAQWSHGAPFSRLPTMPGAGSLASASTPTGTKSSGSPVTASARDSVARRLSGAHRTTTDEPTHLASQELAGQLPSRKEAIRAVEDAHAASEPGARAPLPGASERARAASGNEGTAPARPPTEQVSTPGEVRRSAMVTQSDGMPALSHERRGANAERSLETEAARVNAGRSSPPGHGMRGNLMTRADALQGPSKDASAVAGVGPGAASRRSPATGRPSVPPPTRGNPPLELESPIASQTMRGLAAALRQGNGRVTLHLAPESLGPLRLGISVKGSEVVANVQATTEEAARVIREHASALREALEAQGFAVTRIDVEHVSPALLHLREGARDGQPGATPQWGGESTARGRRHNSEGGGREPGTREHHSSGTPLAEQSRAPANIVGADGVNAIV